MKAWQTLVGGIGTAALLAACGGGGFAEESPQTILEETESDMKALSSVRMVGDIVSDGEELSFDMMVSTEGDCVGTMGVGGGEAELISVGGTSYMKPDAAFWDSFAGAQSEMIKGMVGDKWVLMGGSDGDLSDLCDLDELLEDLGSEDEEEGEVAGTEDVDGQEAVEVRSETDEGDPLTVWVATEDPHHILKMEVTEGDEPGTIRFSDFNEDVDAEAPADDEVVDFNQLG